MNFHIICQAKGSFCGFPVKLPPICYLSKSTQLNKVKQDEDVNTNFSLLLRLDEGIEHKPSN